MTDYERDYYDWYNDQSKAGDFRPEPNREDYDEFGYSKNHSHSGVIEGNKVLDQYLIDTYGIEYARQNPLNAIEEQKLSNDDFDYKKMLNMLLDAIDYSFLKTDGSYDNALTYVVMDKVNFIKKQLSNLKIII